MRTFIEVLRDNAVYDGHAHTFVRMDGSERVVSFPDLWRYACQRAHRLHALGLKKGDRVGIILPEPDSFVLAFIGCLAAGVVPVPMYPPLTLAKLEAYGATVRHVLEASGARALITVPGLGSMLSTRLFPDSAGDGEPVRFIMDEELDGPLPERAFPPVEVTLDDLAFLQFTSGSTTKPKGVMVSHRNLSHNAHAIMFDGLRCVTARDKGLSWLPLFHDMGLIGFVIAPIYALVQIMFLPTMSFIRRPTVWLEAIHRFRASITFAPNFAYALAVRAIDERQSRGWDLSCVKAWGCGAEPIQADVLRTFAERFAPNGLRPEALLPCYGLAEATLAVSFAPLTERVRTDRVEAAGMKRGLALSAAPGAAALELVSCGRPFPGHTIEIRDELGRVLPERMVGEVWLCGPSVTGGYYRNAEATSESFVGGWLRTGDLGYLAQGEIYVCGRQKDLIILNGKNYYPQDIERVASQVSGLRQDQCVAFARLDARGAEECVLVAEIHKAGETTGDIVRAAVQRVRTELGVQLGEVVLIKRGTLPKTSSGKVKRRETRRRLEEGELELARSTTPRPPQVHVPAARASSPALA
jgi:fatty-acyl-CoA synthase